MSGGSWRMKGIRLSRAKVVNLYEYQRSTFVLSSPLALLSGPCDQQFLDALHAQVHTYEYYVRRVRGSKSIE